MINYVAFDQKYPLKMRFSRGWKGIVSGLNKTLLVLLCIFLLLIFVPLFLMMLLPILVFLVSFGQSSGTFALAMIPALVIFLFIPGAIIYGILNKGKHALQIEQFCVDNGFEFKARQNSNNKTGSIFNRGHSRIITNEISSGKEGNEFCLYNYQYSTGSGKSRRSYHFGVAEITLKRKFPHILLDNKKDGSISSFEFDKSQRLELEGDFNKYFSVYGPKEYEIEVLQILSPSVMVALLDMKESFDIEIIGNKMFVYNRGMTTKKQTFQAIFSAIEQLSSSTQSVQATFTMPEQIGDYKPILKRSIWPTVISIVIFLLYVSMQFIPSLLD